MEWTPTTTEPLQGMANQLRCQRRTHSVRVMGKRPRGLFGIWWFSIRLNRPRWLQNIGSIPRSGAEAKEWQADEGTEVGDQETIQGGQFDGIFQEGFWGKSVVVLSPPSRVLIKSFAHLFLMTGPLVLEASMLRHKEHHIHIEGSKVDAEGAYEAYHQSW